MRKEVFEQLLGSDFDKLVSVISEKPKPEETKFKNELTPLQEYNVQNHPVFDTAKRPDKPIKDRAEGRKVNRIGLAAEDLIVSQSAAFLCANPVKYHAAPDGEAQEQMWQAFLKVNEGNKLDYKNQGILEMRMSELEAAEIWYLDDVSEDDDFWSGLTVTPLKKPRLFLAAPSLKDTLYPVWDERGSMMAFGRSYKIILEGGKEEEHFDLYTPGKIYEGVKADGKWTVTPVASDVQKTQVIYHSQKESEWNKVVSIIRRLEDIYSNFADSNDKTAYPILGLYGDVTGLPATIADKAMQMKNGAEAKYIVPPNAPEAIKIEVENLWREFHRLSQTVDITNMALQGVGQTSGVALELLFMPAHLKASKHAGTFGEALQRRINLIKNLIVACGAAPAEGLSLVITPQFDFFLPKDVAGVVNYLATAVTAGIISKETAVNILQANLGGDGKSELEKILAEPQPDTLGNVFDDAA